MNKYSVSHKTQQKGMVLIISLILMTVITLIAVSGMSSSLTQERIAGSHKQIFDAFAAAETGLTRAVYVLQKGDFVWDDSEATSDAIMAGQNDGAIGNSGIFWTIAEGDINFIDANNVTITSTGQIQVDGQTIALRTIEMELSVGGDGDGLSPPAPLTLLGDVPPNSFNAGSSNQFTITGHNAPAIATNENFAGSNNVVVSEIPSNRHSNYTGGGLSTPSVKSMDLGPLWGDPNAIRDFVNQAQASGNPNVRIESGNFTVNPSDSFSEQILIVEGALTWNGNSEFNGIVLVLGGEVTWNGGGNSGINGSLVVSNMNRPAPGEPDYPNWSFDPAGVTFNGGGSSGLTFDPDLDSVVGGVLGGSLVASWREVM